MTNDDRDVKDVFSRDLVRDSGSIRTDDVRVRQWPNQRPRLPQIRHVTPFDEPAISHQVGFLPYILRLVT